MVDLLGLVAERCEVDNRKGLAQVIVTEPLESIENSQTVILSEFCRIRRFAIY